MAATTPPAPPRDLAAAARILAASSDGGELFLAEGLDAGALERLLRALDSWRCDVVGDRLIWQQHVRGGRQEFREHAWYAPPEMA